MTKPTKIPPKLYVTAKLQPIYDPLGKVTGYSTPLGFLNAYEPGKVTFEKKKRTQEDWAYQEYGILNQRLEMHGPELWLIGDKQGAWDPTTRRYEITPYAAPVKPQPQVWDNDPLDGFTILKSVSRYSTSNKLWRILDPRGVELEISTACLEDIIDKAGVRKGGVIDAKCVWMSNKNLIVVP